MIGTIREDLSVIRRCPLCYESYDTIDAAALPCGCGQVVCLTCYEKVSTIRIVVAR
jgi:RING/Ubox like zinc-binding domain